MGEINRGNTDATQCHAQLGLTDQGCTIKELVVCWVLSGYFNRNKKFLLPLVILGCCALTKLGNW